MNISPRAEIHISRLAAALSASVPHTVLWHTTGINPHITVYCQETENPMPEQAIQKKTILPENKMGTMPVGKLLFSMSVPMMISMLVQALYNIVDSVFVSMIEESALTAVSLVFPVQALMISCSVGLAVGINACLSRALGEKDFQRVNKNAVNGIFIELVTMLLFLLIGLFLTRPFLHAQTDDASILGYGEQYMHIICCCSLGLFMEITFERILQSTGKSVCAMATQLIGAIFNIIMDPILIFGLFGAPRLGMAGAASATVIGQHLAALLAAILNHRVNTEVRIRLRGFRPDRKIIRDIFAVGLPSVIMQAIGSVMTYGMNQILIAFTPTATAVFGIYFKINSIIFMPVFGLNNGSVPIIAYNYGAQKRKRILKTIKLSFAAAIIIMSIGCLLFEAIPGMFFSLFHASENMLAIGVPAFRIIGLSFPFAGVAISCSSVFQALGKGVYSMIVSVCRQLLVLLPMAYLLSLTGRLEYIWWSYNIAELVSVLLSVFFLRRIYRKIIVSIPA